MNLTRTTIPTDILEELSRDSKAAGFTSKRSDAQHSRWNYLRKALALARKYSDVISA